MTHSYVPDMAPPVFRHPELLPVLGYRDYFRSVMPEGAQGFVVEDIDLLVRAFGANYQTDAQGKFFLVECKYGRAWPQYAQLKTFGLLDALLRQADPQRERYLGFYIVQHSDQDWHQATFRVNGREVSRTDLNDFFAFHLDLPSYQFPLLT